MFYLRCLLSVSKLFTTTLTLMPLSYICNELRASREGVLRRDQYPDDDAAGRERVDDLQLARGE